MPKVNNKLEIRGDNEKFEHLSLVQEIRATDSDDKGVIEGYVAVWDTVDSYNSRFQRGCFKKTIENRMHKIKVLWNHDTGQPIGKLTEIREDDHGLFIRAKLVDGVAKADEALQLIKAGAVDCFSFGFRTVKQKFDQGIQVITEVMLGEVSPVVFEANPASQITGVRSEDFNDTVEADDLRRRGSCLMDALYTTLDDIWWSGTLPAEEIVSAIMKATGDFATSYTQWAQEVMDMRSGGVRMDLHTINGLAQSFRNYCEENSLSIEQIAQTTSFTIDELRSLKSGKIIADYDRLSELDDTIFESHNSVRSEAVTTLCNDLRAGINLAEATRIQALLQKSLHSEADEFNALMSDFRNNLIGDK